ncbi:hypothetical protein F5X68DRAFT_55099 [Plectosphaerella plurivora]|uniref:Uncharacterized protein n=1 Tax=Plectosphaerella plurivora TaxID=936078 RepID=A0A9P8V228_9PEZI|nr:hypothetical protein F5X68DRAFT_55099 [Plectosphaerella plurivora]
MAARHDLEAQGHWRQVHLSFSSSASSANPPSSGGSPHAALPVERRTLYDSSRCATCSIGLQGRRMRALACTRLSLVVPTCLLAFLPLPITTPPCNGMPRAHGIGHIASWNKRWTQNQPTRWGARLAKTPIKLGWSPDGARGGTMREQMMS